MKRLLIISALLPFAALAQPLNTLNNPNQPGYVIPSQQRMQNEMMSQQQQQQQQQGMLRQQLNTQTQLQQQKLQNQMNANSQRIQQGQMREQPLPNKNGGMLGGVTSQSSGQQHMLPPQQNGDMLNNPQN